MNTYTQDDLRKGVAQYLGLGTFPAGNNEAFDSSLQSAIDYCWRFTDWAFTIVRDVEPTELLGTMYMPEDFDIVGWRQFKGIKEYNTKDATIYEEERHQPIDGVYLEYDNDTNRFCIKGAVNKVSTISYQVTPPKISSGAIHFISHQPIVMCAAIYQKMKDHPSTNDVRQEWNMLDSLLAQLASKNNKNTPLHKPKDRYELYNTHTGDVRG